jgi:excinuclease ABC subunit B
MQRAIDETERRRAKQIAHNEAHGITPRSIQKAVHDILESGYPGVPGSARSYAKVAEEFSEYAELSPEKLARKLKSLEEQMYKHARNLEFEEAARVRDQIQALREHALGVGEPAND